MSTIIVRNYLNQIRHFNAEDLVRSTLNNADEGGQVEGARHQISEMAGIVGRLMGRLPPSEWMEIAGAYHLEEVK